MRSLEDSFLSSSEKLKDFFISVMDAKGVRVLGC
jgi:hypothetical protein